MSHAQKICGKSVMWQMWIMGKSTDHECRYCSQSGDESTDQEEDLFFGHCRFF